jgi:hypothetical protein
MNKDLIKSSFIISMVSYIFFLFCEYLRPGFVSYVFSVHLFLVPIFISGYLLCYENYEHKDSRLFLSVISALAGILLMIIIWREGGVFGDMRIFMAIIGLLLPYLLSELKTD